MSEKTTEKTADKVKGGAVIRQMTYSQENARDRILKRQIPAWVISGALHVTMIGIAIIFFKDMATEVEAKPEEAIVETAIDKAEEPEPDLTNPDLGFDADLAAATEAVEREEAENVEAPVVPEEPIGNPSEASELPTQTVAPPGTMEVTQNAGVVAGPEGQFKQGDGGAGGQFSTPGMKGRSGSTKDALLKAGGGNSLSEAAVAAGLIWLAEQQKGDGRWEFDGSSKSEYVAATGMSLLPFFAAGQTHKQGKYIKKVYLGLMYLTGSQEPSGRFKGAGMYAQAIAAVALCEAYGMTLDPNLKKHAQAACNYIVKAQGPNGSWGYSAGADGDTSIVGWQIQALKSGKLANLIVPDETMRKANYFLDKVQANSGANYGYATAGASRTLTPVGLLCRQYIAGWGPKNPSLAKGVDYLKSYQPRAGALDMYYFYYATQVVHFFGGPDWHSIWNPKMRDWLIELQVKQAGPEKGSWAADSGSIGSHCGRLGTTCLALLTLEVYYRHLPLYKRDNGGLNELER